MTGAEKQYYTFCHGDFFLEQRTNFICSVDTVGAVLENPDFLSEHDFRFDNNGITSFRLVPSDTHKDVIEVIVQYIDCCGDPEETTFYLLPVKLFL